jgi:ABC-type multidrug transport system fused ATPase/permease subunit
VFDGSLGWPQSVFAVVSFDPELYTCLSVLDNIQLGQKNVQFSQMVQVAVNTGVHGYIPSLPLVWLFLHLLVLMLERLQTYIL